MAGSWPGYEGFVSSNSVGSVFVFKRKLIVVYAPAEVIIFLSADIPRNRLRASLLKEVKTPVKSQGMGGN